MNCMVAQNAGQKHMLYCLFLLSHLAGGGWIEIELAGEKAKSFKVPPHRNCMKLLWEKIIEMT